MSGFRHPQGWAYRLVGAADPIPLANVRWLVSAPFAEFTGRHARTLAAQRGVDDTTETEVAKVLDDLLTRAEAGPLDKCSDRVTALTPDSALSHRPPSPAEQPPRRDKARVHSRWPR